MSVADVLRDLALRPPPNIGGGIANSLSLLELFDLLESEINQPLQYTKLPPRESDQRVFVADFRKMRELSGWVPRVSAQDGVSQMLSWVTSQLAANLMAGPTAPLGN